MIREFWADNYKSIRNKQVLNFECRSNEETVASVEMCNGVRLNKLGIIYGANASGKSNILYALQNVFDVLFHSCAKKEEMVHGEGPFALRQDDPTTLYVSFYANRIRYDYQVAYYPSYIVSEELYYYPNNSKSLFYERKYTTHDTQADIRFGNSLKLLAKSVDAIIQNTLNNHSVLSTFQKLALGEDAKEIATLYNWVGSHIHEVNGDYVDEFSTQIGKVNSDDKKKRFYLQMLKKADFNILDFTYSVEEYPWKENSTIKVKKEDVKFLNGSENGQFYLNDYDQSKGTKRYLMILNFLYDMVMDNHVYLMDELDVELHFDLLLYFLNVFLYNSDESQLIFTSQEILLLKEDFLNENRNLVWFAEKLQKTAASVFTRADQFGLHKNLSLFRSYKIGKLGAVPNFGSFLLDLDEVKEVK
jgi:AAA15 family ATPase/GTPase